MPATRVFEDGVEYNEAVGVVRYRARIASQLLLNRLCRFHPELAPDGFKNNPEVVLHKKSGELREKRERQTPFDRKAYRRQYYLDNRERMMAYDRKRRALAKAQGVGVNFVRT